MASTQNEPTPSHYLLLAAREGNLDGVKSIIKRHNNEFINCKNEIGQTPLHLASRNQHLNIVKELILCGANINALDKHCRSPLHAAMSLDICAGSCENLQVVQYLVDNGADLTIQDSEGFTPIHHASRSGRIQILKWIMDHDPIGYLPPSYSPRKQNQQNTEYHTYCGNLVRVIWVDCASSILEMAANILCCLPLWQSYPESSLNARLLPNS